MRQIRRCLILLGSICISTFLFAAAPGKILNIDVNWQQLQALESLNIQQGASAHLLVKPRLAGSSFDITDMTARWEARPTLTTNVTLQATSVWTSNSTHTIAIDLSSTQTGSPVTNWVYSIILVSDGKDYPVGTGSCNIAESGFTGAPSTLLTNANIVTASQLTSVSNSLLATVAGLYWPLAGYTGLTGHSTTFAQGEMITSCFSLVGHGGNLNFQVNDDTSVQFGVPLLPRDGSHEVNIGGPADDQFGNVYATNFWLNGTALGSLFASISITGNLTRAAADLLYDPLGRSTAVSNAMEHVDSWTNPVSIAVYPQRLVVTGLTGEGYQDYNDTYTMYTEWTYGGRPWWLGDTESGCISWDIPLGTWVVTSNPGDPPYATNLSSVAPIGTYNQAMGGSGPVAVSRGTSGGAVYLSSVGLTSNMAVLIPGSTTNWLCITNGSIMAITATQP